MSSSHPASNPELQNERPMAAVVSSNNRSFPSDTRKVSLDYVRQGRYSMNHGTESPAGNQLSSGMGRMDTYIPSYLPSMMGESAPPYNSGMPLDSNRLSMDYGQPTTGLSPLPLQSPPPQSQPLQHNNGSMEDRRYLSGMTDHPGHIALMQQGGSLYPRHMSMDSNPMGKRLLSMATPLPVASSTFLPQRTSTPGPYPLPPLHLMLPKVDDKRSGQSSPLTSFSGEGNGLELQPLPKKTKKRAAPSSSFPIKLHKILSNPDCNEYIDWLPHGRAFRILKAKGFEEHVLPKTFRSSRYSSFMRQVRL
jgi:hypothetical protein